MFIEMLNCLLSGIEIGFEAFFEMLQFYNEVSNIKTELIALIIGVPALLLTIVSVVIAVVKMIRK
ncbi:MAG: hypothetical protein IJK27_03315 [Bacilli bacterium]|nr:hypothetical protein [Bacilli bacterium]